MSELPTTVFLLITHYSSFITVLLNARIRFISPAPQCDSQFNQRATVARGFPVHSSPPHPGAPKLSGRGSSYLGALPHFLSHLPLLSRCHQVSGAGPRAPVVFHYSDKSYNSRRCYRAVDTRHALPGRARRFHEAPSDCKVDATTLALCFGYRRNCLPDALPHLSFITSS